MLEKPNLPDELIIARVQEEYDLRVVDLKFLPLGADVGTAVYRVLAADRRTYFLKLRKGFQEIIVAVPLFLKSQGVGEIIAPLETRSKKGWADFGEYKIILYPFLEGKDSFDGKISDHHKRELGAALKKIHTTIIPPALEALILKENFSPYWRERWKEIQQQAENTTYEDPIGAQLADFIRSKRTEINHLVKRTEELASELESKSRDLVLCHTDIHGANVLIANNGDLYIVDWDNPLLAPKERDLMFIGGGIDTIWKSKQDEDIFYEGYGSTDIDFALLAYYRYERVIEDLVAYAEQLLWTAEGGADRESGYRRFRSNFEPGSTIEIAQNTDKLLS